MGYTMGPQAPSQLDFFGMLLEDLTIFQMTPNVFRYQNDKCLFLVNHISHTPILSFFIHWVDVEIRLKRILRTTLFHVNIIFLMR